MFHAVTKILALVSFRFVDVLAWTDTVLFNCQWVWWCDVIAEISYEIHRDDMTTFSWTDDDIETMLDVIDERDYGTA